MSSQLSVASIVPGTVIPGTNGRCWRADRLLGTGTCCTVWRAHLDGTPDFEAALKVYKSGNAYSAACEREILLLDIVQKSQGKSIFLVEVYDNFQYNGHACVVENCLEASLRNIIYKNLQRPLSISLIKTLLKQLLGGLLALHQVGFVHGDLKPSNLLWNPAIGVLTIIDFGLSFHVHDKKIGQIQTANYRAPECHIWNTFQRDQVALTKTVRKPPPPSHAITGSLTSIHNLPHTLPHLLPSSIPVSLQQPNPSFVLSQQQHHPGGALQFQVPCVANTSQVPGVLSRGTADLGAYSICGNGAENKPLYSILSHPTPPQLEKPGPAADVWSLGIVIMDMAVGGRFIPTKHQVPTAEIRSRVSEIFLQRRDECDEVIERKDWMFLSDICQRIFFDETKSRMTIEQMMLHEFFNASYHLNYRDLWLLPTCVLRLDNVFEDKPYSSEEEQEIINDVLEECVRHGPVVSITLSKQLDRKVFVEFASWTIASAAWESFFKIMFDGRKILATFFLNDDFYKGNHY